MLLHQEGKLGFLAPGEPPATVAGDLDLINFSEALQQARDCVAMLIEVFLLFVIQATVPFQVLPRLDMYVQKF